MSVAVFWDLDGTLLTTSRAGVVALEDAAERVLGVRLDLTTLKTAGLTDNEIADVVIAQVDGASQSLRAAYLDAYADALPERLTQKRGHVMPHVPEIIDAARGHDGIGLGLITGNVRRCAMAKLTSYGLDPAAFEFGGFAEDGHARAEIGAAAVARSGGPDRWSAAYLVGDTPSDVAAGRALGLRTIAVATGGFGLAELAACEPWLAVPELPPAGDFLALVGSS